MKKNLGSVRAIIKRNKPWFVLSDVMKVLEFSANTRPADITSNLDVSEKGVETIHTPGGKQTMVVINESGLYFLICTSSKPKAKEFRLWVTGTVLPAIRKNGGYIAGQEKLKPSDKVKLEAAVKALSDKVDELTSENARLTEENYELVAEVSALAYADRKEKAYIATSDGGIVTEAEYERYYQ